MFKDTQGFKIITILEEMLVKNKIKNIILFKFHYYKYKFINEIFKLKKKINPKNKMDLFKEYFKEYFYLYNVLTLKNITESSSTMTYSTINTKIDCIIFTKGKQPLKFYITYDMITDYFTLFLYCKDGKGINIDERNLESDYIDDIAYDILVILYNIIMDMMLDLFTYHFILVTNINRKEE